MRNSIYGVLILSSFTVSIAFANAENLGSSAGFDGSTGTDQFTAKQSTQAGGTTYNLTADVIIQHVKSTDPANTSCFKNSTGDITFTGANHSLIFEDIVSTAQGAAISTNTDGKTITMSGFNVLSFIAAPQATTGNAAIYGIASITIKENNRLVFDTNHSTAAGGAIHCLKTGATATTLTLEKNASMIFRNNSSATTGGAIHTDHLVLTAGGYTLFENNHATQKGGAISIAGSGELSLSADEGSIIFRGNTYTDAGNRVNNAIYVGANGKFTKLEAKEAQSILFYDPILVEGAAADNLEINKANGATTYTGSIIFSGRHIHSPHKKMKHVSKFTQPLTLAAGSLILEKGAHLEAKSLTQTAGSRIILDQTSSIKVQENVDIKDLWLSLDEFVEPTATHIASSGDAHNVTITGPLGIFADQETFYNHHALAHNVDQELLQLADKDITKISLVDVPESVRENLDAHRGYQGSWTIDWKTVPGSTSGGVTILGTKTATVHWRPTGYIPFGGAQEITTPLVPNTLWGNFSDIRNLERTIESLATHSLCSEGFWATGIKNFLYTQSGEKNFVFQHNNSGYAIGINKHTLSENVFSAAFSQLFGKDRDNAQGQVEHQTLSGSLYAHHVGTIPMLRFLCGDSKQCVPELQASPCIPVIFNAQLSYSHSHNNLTIAHEDQTKTTGNWSNYSVATELGSTFVYTLSKCPSILKNVSPFIKLQGVYSEQRKFTEEGLRRCLFSSTYLANLALPVGIKIQGICPRKLLAYDLSAMYVHDVFRINPETMTLFLIGRLAPWTTPATHLDNKALVVQGSGRFAVRPNIEVFASGNGELRSSSHSYNYDFGAKIHF
ncbi:polymorphic outer membrane protein G family protein [Chlamydia abortus]|uniref:polymorphic outer membrane protein middle domain-containing protein n=1 Tax=Chlamydia abortus TaxID=83555 RepID=UPI000A27E8B5|nr:polymorphic outer membrane protein middle domain-containing protein [Chlamydia abortus]SFZ99113.1 polymorphic outer membrane protein G family protein [Chlamydia abortus]SGA02248.1 polymorphic outer membrane protein G family protein [Chlamydia abortus]SGA03617.1 polymorphic outer membrane protein G family protein [Chlamydia abortus]SGA13454.1 polymorphic outer membrane protein G family protein [Chlamydia abortus]SGA21120.1 polymorphic outer membrane protein G family protein [Chlamydia abortu